MTKNHLLDKAVQRLDKYLEDTRKRKTPERYAILKAVYHTDGRFTVDDLNKSLEEKKIFISRGTLYNTLNLLMRINLVVSDRLNNRIEYEAGLRFDSHCRQICTLCGKVLELDLPEIEAMICSAKLKRFKRERFSLEIYGTCSSCKAKLSRSRMLNAKYKIENK